MMRAAALLFALVLTVLAIPALDRAGSFFRTRRRVRALIEGGRAVLAIGAASLVFLFLSRMR